MKGIREQPSIQICPKRFGQISRQEQAMADATKFRTTRADGLQALTVALLGQAPSPSHNEDESMTMYHRNIDVPSEDVLRVLPRALTKLHTLWRSFTYPFASVGHSLSIHYTCRLQRSIAPAIKLGNSITLGKDSWLNVSDQGHVAIVIDDNCRIGPRCQISAKNSIHLERDVIIAASALVMDHNHEYEDTTLPILEQGVTRGGRIRIGQGSWIGHGAAIVCSSGDLMIGRNCVIGVNAVLTRSIPPYSVVAGNPARVVRSFDPVKQAWVMGSAPVQSKAASENITEAKPLEC
jgi:acetyltransferase-like isoleucine patch superfamily enzyme